MPLLRVSKRSGGTRMAKSGRRRTKALSVVMSRYAKAYLRTILNPSFAGVKIPDSYGAKTCTIQVQREKKLDVNGSGTMGGIVQLSIAPYAWYLGSSGWTGDSYIDGSSTYEPQTVGTPVVSKLPQLFRSGRVVSAGLKVQFCGTTQNDQGTITVFALDRGHMASQAGVGAGNAQIGNPDLFTYASTVDPVASASGDNIRSLPVNAFGPVRMGCTARYYPMDDQDLSFHPYRAPGTSVGPSIAPALTGTVGALGFLCEGCSAGSSIIVQYTVNLECTVRDDAYNLVATEASPVDFRALSAAASVYLRKPAVRVGGALGDTESINVYNR